MADTPKVVFFEGSKDTNPDEEYQRLIENEALEGAGYELPKGYLSNSQISTYLRCGLQYEFRYIKELSSKPSVALAEGKSMHKALEEGLTYQKVTGKVPPLDLLTDSWFDAWKENKKEVPEWDEEPEHIEVRDRTLLWLYHSERMPRIKPIEVEQRFWMLGGRMEVPILGYIDLVADLLEEGNKRCVIDHKVVKKSKSQSDVDNDLQLTLYAKATGIPNVAFESFTKGTKPVVKVVEGYRDKADIEWSGRVIDLVADGISKGNFIPTDPSNWACSAKWCSFWEVCRGKNKKS